MSGVAAILLLAGVHGMVLAFMLARRERNRRANRYLVAMLGALSLLLLDGCLRAQGVLATHPHLIGLSAWVPFLIGPLVYLYVREMTSPRGVEYPPPWRHFVVTCVYVVVLALTFFPRSGAYKREVAAHATSWKFQFVEAALLVYGIGYAVAALVRLRDHREHVEKIYSSLRGVSLRWLFVLSGLNALVWIAALTGFVIRTTGVANASAASLIVPIGSSITLFVIGYFQLGQAEIYVALPAASASPPQEPLKAVANEDAKYQRARLPDGDAEELEARIRAAMTAEKLYQRPGLTLPELADAVGATPHDVSQVLSTRLGKNFYTFINEHRIGHVKAALAASDRPVLELALEAGFQSKSTFNTAFRKATGTTPSEFRQRAKT